ncbi:tetratricopeptide repeat protein [Microcoleus sp. CAWBG52]|uniref:tetratricopeptide repeat protein n=2 Tax=Microcoleus TaxID=44471 RepID=UPI0025EFC1EB|nr:tetratricopeptide repeat protein [Microcoleus sp. CAWBG52]
MTSTSSKPTSFHVSGNGFSALATIGEDAESWQESIQQRVRNHPATKDRPDLQALMLEPVPKLTQAFAESLMQMAQSRGRSLVLILDTYEKAQSYLNQWLWQYLVEDTVLSSAPVRLVVVGRRSLQADEGWRKLNQDRKLLHEAPLKKFSKKDTDDYLKQIGIENGGIRAKIYKATQGLPYYVDWVRKQREEGKEPDFSQGNQAIAELLLQGIDSQQRKILYVVACCRWFDLAMIRYLLKNVDLGLQQYSDNAEDYFAWLKLSDFVEFTKGRYRLDEVARDVFRQSYFQEGQNQFRKTHALLANYFQQQADELVTPEMLLPDPYEEEEWRELISEFLYYGLFGNGKEGLQKYIEQVFTAVSLKEPDIFMAPFAFICAEMNEENQHLLPKATDKFLKDSGKALSFGWHFLRIRPTNYKIKFEGENTPSETEIEAFSKYIEESIQSLLKSVDDLKDSLGKCAGLIYKSLRCNRLREITDSLLQAKSQSEKLTHCHPKLMSVIFSSLGDLLTSVELYEDSLDCYQKALELEKDNECIFFGQGVALANLERFEEALESFEKAISLNHEYVYAWINRGAILGNLQRSEEGLKSFEKALHLSPTSVDIWVNRGKILNNLKRYEEALQSFEKALDIDPKSIDAWINKGIILNDLEKYEESLESCIKALDITPKSVDAWINKGIALHNLDRYEEALENYQKAIEINSKSVDAWVNTGNTLNRLERYEEAIESYQKAIEINPKSIDAWANRGNALNNLRRYNEALASYEKAQEFAPKSVSYWASLANVFLNLERYGEALESYQKAIEINPKSVDAWVNLGNFFITLERYEEALESYQKAIEINPKSANAWSNRGSTLIALERYEEALTACDRAFEIDSSNYRSLNNQALTLSFLNNFEKAIAAIDEAINLEPQEVLLRANRGIILARAGRYTEALVECEQAIKQDPKDESGYYGKACCYALQGEIEQAIDNLQKAIDIAPRRSRIEAKHNPDFDSIRDDVRFRSLMQSESKY